MLLYLYGSQLTRYPELAQAMFRDRAAQFRDRLGWAVTVNAKGEERDTYDSLDPLYVIWQRPDGGHGGSMRFLPTTGQTMVNDHFSDVIGGRRINNPHIWECTRFCLSPKADGRTAAALMLGGAEVMRSFDVRQFVGVFDARMIRIYRRTGASPQVLGSLGQGRQAVSVGLWSYCAADHAQLSARSGITAARSAAWAARASTEKPASPPLYAA